MRRWQAEEHETEAAVDTEMEQPAGDKEEARGDLNLIQLWDLMKEDLRKMKEESNENFRKQEEKITEKNKQTNENLLKQMNEKFDRNEENLKQTNENFK